jgi:hypothetical protein
MGWSVKRATGLTHHDRALSFKGYTLLAPVGGDSVYLLDMDGRIVHRWRLVGFRVFCPKLLPDGRLSALCTDTSLPPPPQVPFDQPPPPFAQQVRRIGGNASHVLDVAWDGKVLWQYRNEAIHHDFVRLPNGNTVVNEFVEIPADLAGRVRGGVRRPREKFPPLISDDFVEIDPTGQEVSRTHLWELLDPVRDPICPLEPRAEWTHTNSLALMPNGDLLFSCRQNSRVGIIERESGRLRWKYGFPDIAHQHHATALPNGNVQIFDNGMHRIGLPYSRVVEVNPETSKVEWEYTGEPPEQFFSAHISGADRLPNGNVLACEGSSGRVFEVARRGEVVWEWVSPFAYPTQGRLRPWIFRAYRYGADYPGLAGRALDPGGYADLNRLHGLG